jgi:hypothetical protein
MLAIDLTPTLKMVLEEVTLVGILFFKILMLFFELCNADGYRDFLA